MEDNHWTSQNSAEQASESNPQSAGVLRDDSPSSASLEHAVNPPRSAGRSAVSARTAQTSASRVRRSQVAPEPTEPKTAADVPASLEEKTEDIGGRGVTPMGQDKVAPEITDLETGNRAYEKVIFPKFLFCVCGEQERRDNKFPVSLTISDRHYILFHAESSFLHLISASCN